MRLWDTFRTAWKLSEEVAQLRADCKETQQRFDDLESTWTDILDKLKARDERQRKRDQRALRHGLDTGDLAQPSSNHQRPDDAGDFDKEAARKRARELGLIRS